VSAQDADGRRENGKTMGANGARCKARSSLTRNNSLQRTFHSSSLATTCCPHMPARRQDFALVQGDSSRLGARLHRDIRPQQGRTREEVGGRGPSPIARDFSLQLGPQPSRLARIARPDVVRARLLYTTTRILTPTNQNFCYLFLNLHYNPNLEIELYHIKAKN